jgi:hypothetical protein
VSRAKSVDDDQAHIKIMFSCARQICQKLNVVALRHLSRNLHRSTFSLRRTPRLFIH